MLFSDLVLKLRAQSLNKYLSVNFFSLLCQALWKIQRWSKYSSKDWYIIEYNSLLNSAWYFCFIVLSKWWLIISITICVTLSPPLDYKFYIGYGLYLFSCLYSQEQAPPCLIPSRWCFNDYVLNILSKRKILVEVKEGDITSKQTYSLFKSVSPFILTVLIWSHFWFTQDRLCFFLT